MEDLNAGRTDADHYDPENTITYPENWEIDDQTMQAFRTAYNTMNRFLSFAAYNHIKWKLCQNCKQPKHVVIFFHVCLSVILFLNFHIVSSYRNAFFFVFIFLR